MSVRGPEFVDTSTEVILGHYELRTVPVANIIRLSQVRRGLNPDLTNIKDSIQAIGLLNPIDIAMVTENELGEYILFTNNLWGSENRIEDFRALCMNGLYALLVAGFTRTEAIAQLEGEDPQKRPFSIVSKIHNINDPEEIIAVQLDENLHSKPALERRAMAIVEAYEYGKLKGRWENEAQFLSLNADKFSKDILRDAMAFAGLPASVRDFVFSGYLSYVAALEIGRASKPLRENVALHLGVDEHAQDETNRELILEAMSYKLGRWIAHIQARGLNSTAAKTYIQGQVEQIKKETAELKEPSNQDELFSMASLGEQSIDYLKKLKSELNDAFQGIATNFASDTQKILALHGRLHGIDAPVARKAIQESKQKIIHTIGAPAIDEALVG